MSADYTHQEGNHAYRAYPFPEFNLYRSDNRSSYYALMLNVRGEKPCNPAGPYRE
jgi:hypothetical protein